MDTEKTAATRDRDCARPSISCGSQCTASESVGAWRTHCLNLCSELMHMVWTTHTNAEIRDKCRHTLKPLSEEKRW